MVLVMILYSVLPQLQKTLAEISEIDKNQINHRALALDKMIQLL